MRVWYTRSVENGKKSTMNCGKHTNNNQQLNA